MTATAHDPWTMTAEGTSTPRAKRIDRGTPQQEAFWDEVANGDSHIVLEARAGTGKSSSCREAIWRLGSEAGRIVYAAFNKHIADEFQRDLPLGSSAATLHSLGFSTLRNFYRDITVDQDKTDSIASVFFPGKWDQDRESRYATVKLVSLCKSLLSDGTDSDGLAELAATFDIDLGQDPDAVLGVVPEVLVESQKQIALIDFDDMIWLPVVLGLTPSPADYLFIDEAQDLSPFQQEFAFRVCPAGRIVVVGDPHQAIYAFRGADSASIETMWGKLHRVGRDVTRFPLTVTWRCPSSHVELAQRIVGDFESHPTAPVGAVESITNRELVLKQLAPGDLAICRTNAPLIEACYSLLREGRRAFVRGRDIGKGLLALVTKLKAKDVPNLISKLEIYRLKELARLSELRNPTNPTIALNDKCSCIREITTACDSVDQVKERIRDLFSDSDEHSAVVFSTIHRAKGLERKTIAILAPSQIPHPMAAKSGAATQEANLAYVAATRSKDRLIFAGPIPQIFDPDDSDPQDFEEGL